MLSNTVHSMNLAEVRFGVLVIDALVIASAMCACHNSKRVQAPSATPHSLQFATSEFVANHTREHRRHTMQFNTDDGATSGTRLILKYLHGARAQGARYVTDLDIYMVFEYGGQPMECKSSIRVPIELPRTADEQTPSNSNSNSNNDHLQQSAGQPDYSTKVTGLQMSSARVKVMETDYVCHSRMRGVVRYKKKFEDRYDVTIKRIHTRAPLEEVLEAQQIEVCGYENIEREVTRYSHHIALKYIPPDWSYISRVYAGTRLIESEPLCYRISAQQLQQGVHRIVGTIGTVGSIEQGSAPPDGFDLD